MFSSGFLINYGAQYLRHLPHPQHPGPVGPERSLVKLAQPVVREGALEGSRARRLEDGESQGLARAAVAEEGARVADEPGLVERGAQVERAELGKRASWVRG